jgi:hypothetical protein
MPLVNEGGWEQLFSASAGGRPYYYSREEDCWQWWGCYKLNPLNP